MFAFFGVKFSRGLFFFSVGVIIGNGASNTAKGSWVESKTVDEVCDKWFCSVFGVSLVGVGDCCFFVLLAEAGVVVSSRIATMSTGDIVSVEVDVGVGNVSGMALFNELSACFRALVLSVAFSSLKVL